MKKIDTNTKLSALWLFILLNIIFRDLHQFANKPFLDMLMTGTYNGIKITEELMLLGGVLAVVPIAMVLFSPAAGPRSLPTGHSRCGRHHGGDTRFLRADPDLDDAFHLVIELAAMVAILWTAWKWPVRGEAPA